MAKDEFTPPVITIDYRRFLQLEQAERLLKENSTISGLTTEEYGEATTLLLQRALENPTVFRADAIFTLGGKYRAKLSIVKNVPTVLFSKVE